MIEKIKRVLQIILEDDFLVSVLSIITGLIVTIIILQVTADDDPYSDATVRLYLSGHEEESEGYHVIVKNGTVIVINSEGKYVTTKENWR